MSDGPFLPRLAVAFRFAAPHWRAACRSLYPRPLFVSPPPGRTAPAPGSRAILMPAHWPPRAASRCTAKPLTESLALSSKGWSLCWSSPYFAPLGISAIVSGQKPACRSGDPRKTLDTVQGSWEIRETASGLRTAPAGLLSALRRRPWHSLAAEDRRAECCGLVRSGLLAKSRFAPWDSASAPAPRLDPGSAAAPRWVPSPARCSACFHPGHAPPCAPGPN